MGKGPRPYLDPIKPYPFLRVRVFFFLDPKGLGSGRHEPGPWTLFIFYIFILVFFGLESIFRV